MTEPADPPQLWWHFYGVAVPDMWDVTMMLSGTSLDPETAREKLPASEIDGSAMPYLCSWDHRPTIAEQNVPRLFAGLNPEPQPVNCDEYGDVIEDDDDDLPF